MLAITAMTVVLALPQQAPVPAPTARAAAEAALACARAGDRKGLARLAEQWGLRYPQESSPPAALRDGEIAEPFSVADEVLGLLEDEKADGLDLRPLRMIVEAASGPLAAGIDTWLTGIEAALPENRSDDRQWREWRRSHDPRALEDRDTLNPVRRLRCLLDRVANLRDSGRHADALSAIATGRRDLQATLTPVGKLALILIECEQLQAIGDLPGARTALETAWRAGEPLGWREYDALLIRGMIANAAHDWVAQLQDNNRAAKLAKNAGDQFTAQNACLNSAVALLQLGRARDARGLLQRAVEDGGPPVMLASLLVTLSLAHQQLDEVPRALVCLQRAVAITEQAEPPLTPRHLASILGKAGCILHSIGYPDRAVPILRRAENTAKSAGVPTRRSARGSASPISSVRRATCRPPRPPTSNWRVKPRTLVSC